MEAFGMRMIKPWPAIMPFEKQKEESMSIKLGQMVKDVITGLRGVAIARIEYMNGFVQYEVQPPVDKDGKWLDGKWFQEKNLASVKGAKAEVAAEVEPEIAAAEPEESDEPEMDDDFAPKKKAGKKKAAPSFDEEEEEEEEAEEADEADESDEEEEVAPKKKGKAAKAKKLTSDDLNDAAKARVARLIEEGNGKVTGKMARDNVLKLLKKHFSTETVSEIDDQDDMARAIKLLGASK
jgi:hypothetical protein